MIIDEETRRGIIDGIGARTGFSIAAEVGTDFFEVMASTPSIRAGAPMFLKFDEAAIARAQSCSNGFIVGVVERACPIIQAFFNDAKRHEPTGERALPAPAGARPAREAKP